MLLVGLSLHSYLEKTWLHCSGRQDSPGSGGSPSNRGLKEAETQGFGTKECLPYTPLLWPWILKSGFPGSTDEFENQAFPWGRREEYANKHFHQCAEV